MKKILILSLILILFFTITSVSASDINETTVAIDDSDLVSIEEPSTQFNDNGFSSTNEVVDDMAADEISSDVVGSVKDNDSLAISDDDEIMSAKSSDDLNNTIQNAAVGSTINLNFDYTFSNQITIDKNLTINGRGHTLNGNNKVGIFIIPKNVNVILYNIKFINGRSSNGGAILNYGTLTLDKCTFKDNSAYVINTTTYDDRNKVNPRCVSKSCGGAIYNGGNLDINDCEFNNNIAKSESNCYSYLHFNIAGTSSSSSYGGAIYNSVKLTISNSSFIKNSAYSYCNLYSVHSDITSYSSSYGGAIYSSAGAVNSARLNILNCNFIENNANAHSHSTINGTGNPTIKSNVYGGVIYTYGQAMLNNVALSNNTAIANSTFNVYTGNQYVVAKSYSEGYGGAIYNEGSLTATNISATKTILYNDNWGIKFKNKISVGHENNAYGVFIYNKGSLTIKDSVLEYNRIYSRFPSDYQYLSFDLSNEYGGIYNSGTLNIFNSSLNGTFSLNSLVNISKLNTDNMGCYGGLFYNSGLINIKNSSFTNNLRLDDYPWIYGSYIYNKGSFTLNYSNFTNTGNINADIINTKANKFDIYNSNLQGFNITNIQSNLEVSDSSLANINLNNSLSNCDIDNSIFKNVIINHENNNLNISNSNLIYSPISTTNTVNSFYNTIFYKNGMTSSNKVSYLNKCSFIDCSNNKYGGAIYCSGNLVVGNSSFVNNYVSSSGTFSYGGAIYCSGNLVVGNSSFVNNSAHNEAHDKSRYSSYAYGGAIYCSGNLVVGNSSFKDNSAYSFTLKYSKSYNAYSYGGAIYCDGDLIVDSSTFAKNSISSYSYNPHSQGGAIYCCNGELYLNKNNINSNKSEIYVKQCNINSSINLIALNNGTIKDIKMKVIKLFGKLTDDNNNGLIIKGSSLKMKEIYDSSTRTLDLTYNDESGYYECDTLFTSKTICHVELYSNNLKNVTSKSGTLIILGANLNMNVNDNFYGQDIIINITLLDDERNPLNGNIELTYDNKKGSFNVVGGRSSLVIKNLNVGQHSVYASYSEDFGTISSCRSSFNVNPIESNIQSQDMISFCSPNTCSYSFLLEDKGGPLIGKTVKIVINGDTRYVTTNSDGIGIIKINIAKSGTYSISISFEGDSTHSAFTSYSKITLKKNNVKFVSPTKKVKKSKSKRTFKITLKTSNNIALAKKYVYIKINKKTYKAKTNAKGVATFKMKLPMKKKNYKYTLTFKGDTGNYKKTFSGKLKVY